MQVKITKTFQPKSTDGWREWLTKNHAKKKEIWVIFYKKATGKQIISIKEAVDQALCFGWIDSVEKGVNKESFALRFTPRSPKSNWSEYNVERYNDLLKKGLVTPSGKMAFENKGKIYTH